MAIKFTPRTTKPTAGNKYYIRKANGGYSDAIQGSPVDKECNVLSNCVGYAYGRFNEIGGYGACKYLAPVNAENFMQYKGDCKTGTTPKIGACMVWQKGATLKASDGAGHVAIVERVISDTEVVTSESAWGGSAFYTKTRKKGNGDWGEAGKKFLGFIYNPAECCNDPSSDIKIGDVVTFTGNTHYLNPTAATGTACTKGKAKVTNINSGKHPYHIVGDYHSDKNKSGCTAWGWVDAKDVTPIAKPVDVDANVKAFINAALADGFVIGWETTVAKVSEKCLVQKWADGKNRYPSLTKLAQKLMGMTGNDVDGYCGDKTTAKIKETQKAFGLTVDGGIGRKTWEKLLGVK